MRWIVLGGAFVIFWFLALQIVLPIGNRTAHEADETLIAGVDPGAPAQPKLAIKLAVATGAALAMWIALYMLVLLKIIEL